MAVSAFLKSFLIPLLVSAILYGVIFHALLPLYRQHRARYSQYLPLSIASNRVAGPSSLRHRVSQALFDFLSYSRWGSSWLSASRNGVVNATADEIDGDEELDETVWNGLDTNTRSDYHTRLDNRRRLSRELEEGFRDSSDEEDNDHDNR